MGYTNFQISQLHGILWNKLKISKFNEICTDFHYNQQTHGVRCLVPILHLNPITFEQPEHIST